MRLAVLSNMPAEHKTWWRNLAPPIENTLGDMPGVTVVNPPSLRRATFRANRPAWLSAIRTVRRADAVFWIQLCYRPLLPVWALGYARPLARRVVMASDVWESKIPGFARLVDAQSLDIAYLYNRQAFEKASIEYPDVPIRWLPIAYNADAFYDRALQRDIDVFWMGRRDPDLHNALLRLAARGRIVYEFIEPPDAPLPQEEINELACRSRFFVVTPPDVSDAVRTGSFSPLTCRYLEGLAAGARLLGTRPRSGELEDMVGPSAVVECRLDGSDLEDVLDRADAETGTEVARARLRDIVVSRHTWQGRAANIYQDAQNLLDSSR